MLATQIHLNLEIIVPYAYIYSNNFKLQLIKVHCIYRNIMLATQIPFEFIKFHLNLEIIVPYAYLFK